MKNRVTINDIAKLTGVSKTTVSFYLNGRYEKMSAETQDKIREAIQKTGYRPSAMARSLNLKRSHLIGVIIGDITNSFASMIVKGIDEYCRDNDYQMIVGDSDYNLANEKRCVDGMVAMGVDGFIVQPTVNFETMWNSLQLDKPIVYFDSPNRLDQGFWVKTNNYKAVMDAMEHMIEEGYQKFVMISADPDILQTRLERNRGFVNCMEKHHLPYEVILADSHTTPEMIEKRLQPYLEDPAPVCVFAGSNWLLDKTYLVMRKYAADMPNHLGLIGFDSLEWTELAVPSITTIVQPAYEEGKKAARILIDVIEKKGEEAPNCILKCRLNEMASTQRKG